VWSNHIDWWQGTQWMGYWDVLSGVYEVPPLIQGVGLAG
jgi:hypothetical protein